MGWIDETLRMLKGTPHPEVSVQSIAERLGVEQSMVRKILADLESEGTIVRQGERWIVVEPAVSAAPPDEPIP
jgi:DNA-binding GntR family transcriptional regulator